MNETQLARVETSIRHFSTSDPKPVHQRRWHYQVEASCWLFLAMHAPDADMLFCLEYSDSLKKYSIVIDRSKVGYLRQSLLTGSISVEGFGDFKDARLVLISDEANTSIAVQSLNFNVVRSSDSVTPKYRLVA